MNDEAIFRTAPATPDLLKILHQLFFSNTHKCKSMKERDKLISTHQWEHLITTINIELTLQIRAFHCKTFKQSKKK